MASATVTHTRALPWLDVLEARLVGSLRICVIRVSVGLASGEPGGTTHFGHLSGMER
jgi:hypothetical protein